MNRFLLAVFCLLILIPVTSHASAIQLPQSGQTSVYSVADDGDIKAGKPWPTIRFNGNSDQTVTDNLTGLIWAKDVNLMKNRDPGFDADDVGGDGAVSWQHALNYIHRLNTEKYLGHNDWRLPNLNELNSLLNQGEVDVSTWLTTQGFLGAQSLLYWSSSTNVMSVDTAWTVGMTSGPLNYQKKTEYGCVWPVRGGESGGVSLSGINLPKTGQVTCFDTSGTPISCAGSGQDGELQTGAAWPQPRFMDNGDQTVTDNLTGLIWARDANLIASRDPSFSPDVTTNNGAVNWQTALDYVLKLNQDSYQGFGDWRLPNRNELASVMNYVEANPFAWLSWQGIFNVRNNYWTSATVAALTGNAWNVHTTGVIVGENKSGINGGSFIWPVRGGITPDAAATGSETDALQTVSAKSLAKNDALVTASAALSVSTTTLANGYIGAAYSQTLAATGGTTPYTWSKSSGTLPAGLSLSSAGVIGGTPTKAGTSSVTFKVKDAKAATVTKTLSITINAVPPTITTTSLSDGYIGVGYNKTLVATGGKTPYTWSRTSGSLPAGLSLSTTGIISGTPTSVGTGTFTVQVKDASTITATKSFNVTIALPLNVTTTTLPNASVGSVYGQTLAAIGGKTPYTWSITTGILPAGVILNASTGMISGTPTVAGTTSFTVQAKDANNTISTMELGLTVKYPANIVTTAVHDGYVGIAYSQALAATNGVPPYTWSISGGSLPAGLSLDTSTGMIGGTPTTTGASNFTVQIIDASNTAATRAYTVNITGFGSINGSVTEQTTGAPIPGATVTLNLSDIKNRNSSDFIYSCEDMPISADDYSKISANDDAKLGCSGSYDTIAKVRNPFGVADPFTIRWNGLNAYGGGEYLAQSFKPTKSGRLNRVSFYFSGYSMTYGTFTGSVYVLLKSAIGGDIGTYLANSAIMNVTPQTSTGWVDFDFTSPVSVAAGQEYFVELQGRFPVWPISGETYYDTATWGNGIQYSDGRSYQRSGGIWGQLDNSLAFRTYVDANPDITTTLPTQGIDMHGAVSYTPKIYLNNISSGQLESCGIDYGYNPNFSVYSNSSDYNCTKTATNGNNYYDQNGWITVTLFSQSSYSSLSEMYTTHLVTDQFSLTFNRTLSTVTDANGAYSFANLPDGNYSVSINNPAYLTQSTGGSITPGQTVDIGTTSLAKAPPSSLQGQIQLNGGSTLYGAGVTVTLTDPSGTHTTVSDADGNYRVDGVAYGAYSVTFSGPYLQSVTKTGTLAAGQTATLDVWLNVKRPAVTITSPLDGGTVTTSPFYITGSATDTETVTASVLNNGVTTTYQGAVINNAFSIPVVTGLGTNQIDVSAGNSRSSIFVKVINVNATFFVHNLGDSGNVALMELTGNFDAKDQDGSINELPRKAVAAEYFKGHTDVDFLVFLTTFGYNLPESGAEGFYLTIRNDVQGINQPIFDNSAQFGSGGKLQGTIDLGNISALAVAPFGPLLDSNVRLLNHELMHRFGSYVRYKNPDGSLNTTLLGKDSAHWSYLLDTQGSIMYGNGWKSNGDGTFTSTSVRSGFSPLDLYLMGMIPKEQVPAITLIDNSTIDKTQLPQPGATISGTAKTVTIDDIIAAEGARIPDARTSQKKLNVGFVLLTRAGDNTSAALQAIETLRSAWAGRFAELTQGIGGIDNVEASVSVGIDSPGDGSTITGPDVTVTGSVINTTGLETGVTVNGIVASVTGSRFIANHVPLQPGANTITVTATDVNGLTATTTRSVTDQAGHYIRINSTIESGVAPLDVSLRLDSSFSITNQSIMTSGPASITLAPGASATEFTTKLIAEGTYTITVSAAGPDGKTYTDSVTITVVSLAKIDALLKSKWAAMKGALANNDVASAVMFFNDTTREKYQGVLQFLSGNLSSIAAGLRQIEPDYIRQDVAEYRISQTELINGQSRDLTYFIYFVRDKSGLWKIESL